VAPLAANSGLFRAANLSAARLACTRETPGDAEQQGDKPNKKKATEGDLFFVPGKLNISRTRLMFERPELFRQLAA
jgi:hypothetical protein